eukprot:gene16476-34370_t
MAESLNEQLTVRKNNFIGNCLRENLFEIIESSNANMYIRFRNAVNLRSDSISENLNSDGESLLFFACRHGAFEIVRFLIIVKKLDPSFLNKDGLSCLHIACYNGHYSTVEFLILIAEANPNITDN